MRPQLHNLYKRERCGLPGVQEHNYLSAENSWMDLSRQQLLPDDLDTEQGKEDIVGTREPTQQFQQHCLDGQIHDSTNLKAMALFPTKSLEKHQGLRQDQSILSKSWCGWGSQGKEQRTSASSIVPSTVPCTGRFFEHTCYHFCKSIYLMAACNMIMLHAMFRNRRKSSLWTTRLPLSRLQPKALTATLSRT